MQCIWRGLCTFMRALRCMLRCSASDFLPPAALLVVGLSGEIPRAPSGLSVEADRPLLWCCRGPFGGPPIVLWGVSASSSSSASSSCSTWCAQDSHAGIDAGSYEYCRDQPMPGAAKGLSIIPFPRITLLQRPCLCEQQPDHTPSSVPTQQGRGHGQCTQDVSSETNLLYE